MIDLAEAQDKLRKIQREIGRMNNRTQIGYLMKNRDDLLKNVETKKALLFRKIDLDPLELEIFRTICRALSVYGRGVIESVILTFERESGKQSLEISENAVSFRRCLQKVFGRSSARKIESTIVFEISNEFGLLVSSKTTLPEAINIVKSNTSKLHSGQNAVQEK